MKQTHRVQCPVLNHFFNITIVASPTQKIKINTASPFSNFLREPKIYLRNMNGLMAYLTQLKWFGCFRVRQ